METSSEQAVEAARVAQEAVEHSRADQMDQALKPIYAQLADQDRAFATYREDITKRIDSLATKEYFDKKFEKFDNFVSGFNTTVQVGGFVGKYGFKTLTVIATLFILVGVISGGFKGIIAALAAWATTK